MRNQDKIKQIETQIFLDADSLKKGRLTHDRFNQKLKLALDDLWALGYSDGFERGQRQMNIFQQIRANSGKEIDFNNADNVALAINSVKP